MGQPTPPGDMPLIDGLGPEWNEFVSAIPEDRRSEIAPKLKERVNEYEGIKKQFEPWQEFTKSGITPEHAGTALDMFSIIENNPREVYETIGKYLGITPAQAKEVVEEIKEQDADDDDPRLRTMQEQIETLAQIQLAQRDMTLQEQRAQEADNAVEEELTALKAKVGEDFPEDEILMRMLHKDMTAEEAYAEYSEFANQIRSRRPAPMVLGQGGAIPSRAIDPTKLDSKGTKDLVRQMLDHSNAQRKS